MMIKLKIKKLNKEAILPEYKSEQASGMDLYALKHDVIFSS